MATLTRNNCKVDPKSGGVIFQGSPELQEMRIIRQEIQQLHNKLDKLLEVIQGGSPNGREMENPRLSKNNDPKI